MPESSVECGMGGLAITRRSRKNKASFQRRADNAIRDTGSGPDVSNHWPWSEFVLPQAGDDKTQPLQFRDFTLLDPRGFPNESLASSEQKDKMGHYLADVYGAVAMSVIGWYIVLEFESEKHIPPPEEQPLSIAGLPVIWTSTLEFPSDFLIRDLGDGDDQYVENGDVEKKLRSRDGAQEEEAMLFLANNVFPDCEAMIFTGTGLIIELPLMSEEAFEHRLQRYPYNILRCVTVSYNNGPVADTELRISRVQEPQPRNLATAVIDETDYLQEDSCFYPGCLVASVTSQGDAPSLTSAGILVQKGNEKRLTCAFHGWADQVRTSPTLLGQDSDDAQTRFRVTQGLTADSRPGTTVGYLKEHLGPSDTGLLKLGDDIRFDNSFLDGHGSRPKTMVHTNDLRPGDDFFFESFATGRQRLKLLGIRRKFRHGREAALNSRIWIPPGTPDDAVPRTDAAYVILRQGMYATTAALVTSGPVLRHRVCGSVLLRCRMSGQHADLAEPDEVCGMMHLADLQSPYSDRQLVAFADGMDSLIEEGWEVAQTRG